MDDDDTFGLSPGNRTYIVTLVFFALLFFGPEEPDGVAIHIFSLVALPAGVWLALRFGGSRLKIDARSNDNIHRALTASVAGMLIVAAYQSFTAKHHLECTQSVRDGQGGTECVGDEVLKSGPDRGMAFFYILLAGTAFWAAVARKPN